MNPRRILFLIVIGILAGYAWWRYEHRGPGRAAERFTLSGVPRLRPEDVKVLSAIDEEYTRLVQSVVPSVVSITSSRTVTQLAPRTIQDLFTGQRYPQSTTSTSLGSGVIVSKEGHILTNHHVVAGMTEIGVQLTDGRNFPAKLVGNDPPSDIAVLRIEAQGIEALPLGDSDTLRVGQQIFAVGNPYGLEESVTRGIISAKGRRTTSDSAIESIQHDAAVNQGNSGGPLLNVRGEIVGINSQIFSRTGGWQGISFAIPSNAAKQILGEIVKNGRVVRGYLGMEMDDVTAVLALRFGVRRQDVTAAHAQQFALPDADGAVITSVTQGSPAALCGLLPGDVVRSVNGRQVKSMEHVRQMIFGTEIGQEIEFEIIRNGATAKTKAKIAQMPPEPGSVMPGR